MNDIQYISERVSVSENETLLTIVIQANLGKIKNLLLFIWLILWMLCGSYFIIQLMSTELEQQLKLWIIVILSFWFYYLFKISHIYLWRKFGFEIIKVNGETLQVKNDIKGFGKVKSYFITNISNLAPIETEPNSFIYQVENSFWVNGGARLCFTHNGHRIAFGQHLEKHEKEGILRIMKRHIKKN